MPFILIRLFGRVFIEYPEEIYAFLKLDILTICSIKLLILTDLTFTETFIEFLADVREIWQLTVLMKFMKYLLLGQTWWESILNINSDSQNVLHLTCIWPETLYLPLWNTQWSEVKRSINFSSNWFILENKYFISYRLFFKVIYIYNLQLRHIKIDIGVIFFIFERYLHEILLF